MVPRVTLGMPAYNAENYIEIAIDSILAQSFADFELIITDNASVDNTEAICRRLAQRDSRIRYFRNERNLGAGANYNLGFRLARGEFFKWCAHDDFISKNYVQLCVEALDRDSGAVLAYGPSQMVNACGDPTQPESATLEGMDNPDAAWRFLRTVRIGGSDCAIFGVFRRNALARSLLQQPYYQADRALLAEMSLLGRFIFVPEITFYNRAHPGRSVTLTDRVARMKWQNAAGNRFALERLPLLRQLFIVAWRHRQIVAPSRTIPQLTLWAMAPIQLGSYALELIGLVAPQLSQRMRNAWNSRRLARERA